MLCNLKAVSNSRGTRLLRQIINPKGFLDSFPSEIIFTHFLKSA